MNRTLKFATAAVATTAVVGALALGASLAQAQGGSPWNGFGMMSGTVTPYPGMGGNGMRGNGQRMMAGVDMNAMQAWMTDTGGMHTQIWASLSETLGLTPDELSTQIAAGQTLAEIAEAQGVSQEQLSAAHQTSVTEALEQAVADGVLTQVQADQLLAHMSANSMTMFSRMGAMGSGRGPGWRTVTVTPAVP